MKLRRTLSVRLPMAQAFRMASDFTFLPEWDPSATHARKCTPGAVGIGTRYAIGLQGFGRRLPMTYTVTEMDPPHKVVLEGVGETFSATDTLTFTEKGPHTRILYEADIRLPPFPEIFRPLIRYLLENMASRSMGGLFRALQPEPRPPASVRLFAKKRNPVDRIADRLLLPGLLGFGVWGHRIARRFFSPNGALLTKKTAILTGPTSGLGKAAAMKLAERDATLVLVARNREKGEALRDEISHQTGNPEIRLVIADLETKAGIFKAAAEIENHADAIDILIHNAGALYPKRMETEDGIERTFALDLMAPYLFTRVLAPLLEKARSPRILAVSSGGMYTQKIRVDDLEMKTGPFDGPTAYARAKRGLLILTEHWAKRFSPNGVAHAMHPGWVDTPGLAASLPTFHKRLRPLLRTPDEGADTLVWLASSVEAGACTGLFWLDRRPHTPHVFPWTLETAEERDALLARLEALATDETGTSG